MCKVVDNYINMTGIDWGGPVQLLPFGCFRYLKRPAQKKTDIIIDDRHVTFKNTIQFLSESQDLSTLPVHYIRLNLVHLDYRVLLCLKTP